MDKAIPAGKRVLNGQLFRDKIDEFQQKTGEDFNANYKDYEFANIWDDGCFVFFNANNCYLFVAESNCPLNRLWNYFLAIAKELKIPDLFMQFKDDKVDAAVKLFKDFVNADLIIKKRGIPDKYHPDELSWTEVMIKDFYKYDFVGGKAEC